MDALGVCWAYAYIDLALYNLSDFAYPDIADDLYSNLFDCTRV